MVGIRIQNALAAIVFLTLLACVASMQLLSYFPSNDALWFINIYFAREGRPVLELLDVLPFGGLAQNIIVIVALLGLCVEAARKNSHMMTSTTSHIALYAVAFAGIASYSRTFGNLQSASLNIYKLPVIAGDMDTSQLALSLLLALLVISCFASHYQIISHMIRNKWGAKAT